MLTYLYFDKSGSKAKDLNTAFIIEGHDSQNTKITYWINIAEKYKLRNTYQVPAGEQVVVNTPQGEKKYTGGQYVPPEQLGNARVTKAGDGKGTRSGSSGQSENSKESQEQGPQWDEISEQFKSVDISKDENVNKTIYNLKDYLPCNVEVSSKKVLPTTKLGAYFALANISQSLPFVKDLLQNFTLYLTDPITEPYIKIFGSNFIREGVLALNAQYIKYYQKKIKPEQSLIDASTFVAQKIAHVVIYNVYNELQTLKQQLPQLNKQKIDIQNEIKKNIEEYAKLHKGRMPKDQDIPVVQELSEQLQSIEISLQKNEILTPLMKELKDATLKEGGITRYIDNSLETDVLEGVINQFAKAVSMANNYSLGTRKTFMEGMENIAGSHPETLSAIKKLVEALTQLDVT